MKNKTKRKTKSHNAKNEQQFKQTSLLSNQGIPGTPQHTDSHPCTRPWWQPFALEDPRQFMGKSWENA